MAANQKKRHHYVPITYLNNFTDSAERLFAYRKDDPIPPLHLKPSEIAFERYYYSQPMPEGAQDNNRLEDYFSTIESEWPDIVATLVAGRPLGPRTEALFQFIGLMRVRGPAARDPVELHLGHMARRTMLRLADEGRISAPPAGLTLDDLEIAIDPHQSLHAMVAMLQGFGQLCNHFGIEVVHNATSEPFITSDNPVVIFDPDVPEQAQLPYTVCPPAGRIELLFPVSSRMLLRGRSELPVSGPSGRLGAVSMSRTAEVRRVNRHIARFGYRFVFADHSGLAALVTKYAALSPTIRFDDVPEGDEGEFTVMQMVFGPRPQKPKWRDGER